MSVLAILTAAALSVGQSAAAEVSVAGPQGPLRGTLQAPEDRAGVAVLIIPGSGPTDRDGNNPMGVQAASYRLLAEGLAQRGIASLRIDKRGMFGSRDAIPNANHVTIADYASDVAAWLPEVRRQTGVRCVWLLGHSEGGLVALAAREQEGVCGLILVAAPGQPVGRTMRAQLRANPANAAILDEALAAIDGLEAGQRVDAATLNPALRSLFAAEVQPFLIDLFSHDPARLLVGYERPVLVMGGTRDIQVSETETRALAEANPRARLAILSNVNHVLKSVVSEDRAVNIATYGDPSLPLADGVIDTIADFVAEHRRP